MILQNKLGLTNEAELAGAEEKLSKTRALELYDTGLLDTFEVGTFKGLAAIHKYLFGDVYEFAGTDADGEYRKGQFPLCACDVPAPGTGKHRCDAAILLR